jgi:exopolysaccharide biosynthesis protein
MLCGYDSKPANEQPNWQRCSTPAKSLLSLFLCFFVCLLFRQTTISNSRGRRRNWVCWCQSEEYTVSVNFKILTSRRKKKKKKKKKQQKRLSYTHNKNNNITKHATILLRSLTITLLLLLLLLFFLKGFW